MLRGPVVAMTYVPVAAPLSEVDEAFVAFTETLYEPSEVPVGEVTVKVAVPLLPGESDSLVALHTPPQPDGTRSPRLNVAVEQEELSLLTTVAVKFTAVPGVTP
jgi:hypothetical protein